ncbi:MAG: hypothetical protein EZS28_015695 [Streblomastix strix]|uniref:Uncharacterized protein n=1 Tax=Streblomastix strix TaxID=222440 RepID=A0A5J4W297_9EUKA|nr:MAG: hypothetical protein EZS28_015695 [Streblomastix strix]
MVCFLLLWIATNSDLSLVQEFTFPERSNLDEPWLDSEIYTEVSYGAVLWEIEVSERQVTDHLSSSIFWHSNCQIGQILYHECKILLGLFRNLNVIVRTANVQYYCPVSSQSYLLPLEFEQQLPVEFFLAVRRNKSFLLLLFPEILEIFDVSAAVLVLLHLSNQLKHLLSSSEMHQSLPISLYTIVIMLPLHQEHYIQ